LLVIPPIYGIATIFLFKTLPPFVPQDSLTKLEYGTLYGYFKVYTGLKQFLGFNMPASTAESKILDGTIIDVSNVSYTNLARIPEDWGNYASDPTTWEAYGSGKQIIFLDFNVVRTLGKPTIHFSLPHTSEDMNEARECDGRWIPVNEGDHVTLTTWIKTTLSDNATYNSDPADTYGKGARIGFDFYHDNTNLMIGALVNGLGSDTVKISGYPQLQSAGSHVPWNTPSWTKQTIDFIVPSGYNINQIVAWMQVVDPADSGQAWFADAELYINRDYSQYTNMSLTFDSLFSNITSEELSTYYSQYCYSMGINETTPWALDLFVVSKDGKYLISDCYIEYQNQNFTISLNKTSTQISSHYGVIVTEDAVNSLTEIIQGGTIDYVKVGLLILSSLRNENIVLFSY
jgi:hypothetical protein